MDPDSPFAHPGAPEEETNLRSIGTTLCHQCKHEWVVPVKDDTRPGKCPMCGSLRTTLKDVRKETAPRV